MTTPSEHVRRCTVYSARGEPQVASMELDPEAETSPFHVPAADRTSIREIMSRDLVCARPDLEIAQVVGLMTRHRVGCIPVVDEHRRPIGVITKFDICEQLDGAMRAAACGCPLPSDLTARIADDVMVPTALRLEEHATIARAASMMMAEDTHHVLAVSNTGALVGIVSSKDIVGWVVRHDVLASAWSLEG